uniref:THAP-type domain-containing protein n=1 Tax=Ixodes ricinus TaxID=34613 RepID=A0A131XSX5_IXORI
MTQGCGVMNCRNKARGGSGVRFFRFPCERNHKRKRSLWIAAVAAVNRTKADGTPWVPSSNSRVCSAHFHTGQPSRYSTHPDHVPSIFNDQPPRNKTRSQKRANLRRKRGTSHAAVPTDNRLHNGQQEPVRSVADSGDGGARLEEICCPLENTTDSLFRCCFCTHVTGDQRGIVNHLIIHGDEEQRQKSSSAMQDLIRRTMICGGKSLLGADYVQQYSADRLTWALTFERTRVKNLTNAAIVPNHLLKITCWPPTSEPTRLGNITNVRNV